VIIQCPKNGDHNVHEPIQQQRRRKRSRRRLQRGVGDRGAQQALRRGAEEGQEGAPRLRRSPPTDGPHHRSGEGRPRHGGNRIMRPQGLHHLHQLRERRRQQEAQRYQLRPFDAFHFRVVPDSEAEHQRMEQLPTAVSQKNDKRRHRHDFIRIRSSEKEVVSFLRRLNTYVP
jgi:hypothetical protein